MRKQAYYLTEIQRQILFEGSIWKANVPIEERMELINLLKDPIPEEEPTPLWRSELFTDEERELMASSMMHEVSDSIKGFAHDALDGEDLVSLIGYACPDAETYAECYKALDEGHCDSHDLRSGEHEGHLEAIEFAKRFKLMNEDETELTDDGREFVERFG